MTPPDADTLWRATTKTSPAFATLAENRRVQVAVIGGGFTGLSTALSLARRGVDVLLLEARRIGFGASGRNAGFVVPNFSKADPDTVLARLGAEKGLRLLDLVGRGGDRVFALAREAELGRQAEANGWLQPAHSADAARMLRERVARWQAIGRPVTWIGAAETAQRTGMDIYHGALANASGGMINPLAYAYGLARLAAANGVSIVENTPVETVTPLDQRWQLATPGGAVVANTVILCTNAETTGAARRLARSVVPLNVYQIATEPLDPEQVARISPRREPVSDTRANIFTYRLDADNRLISGGMALVPMAASAHMSRRIAARLAHELALPAVPRIAHCWRGTAAVTQDFLPHIYR